MQLIHPDALCLMAVGWHTVGNTDDMLGVTSFPEMDYKLGAPKGPAAETEEGVWRRDFASGAFVIWVSPGLWFGCSMFRRSVRLCHDDGQDNNAKNGTYSFPGQPTPAGV